MGFYKVLAVIITLAMLLIPLTAFKTARGSDVTEEEKTSDIDSQSSFSAEETVKVFMSQDDLVLTVTVEEYLVGVLAAEMLPTYHEHALKAQAVAAHTYLLYKKAEQEASPDAGLKGAYLSDNAATHQGYMSEEQRAEKWGDKAESYEEKLRKAVEDVCGKVITYEGKPIIAAFHANNSGVTQSAETVWGGEVPYLKSVTSVGDKLSPDCIKTVAMSSQDVSAALSSLDGCSLNGEASEWISGINSDENGYIKSVSLGGKSFSGLQARDSLGLRSAVFTFEFKDDTFYFTTQGYGHGVGMSQYGADYMARQGSTWDEIIKHYYSGVEISDVVF